MPSPLASCPDSTNSTDSTDPTRSRYAESCNMLHFFLQRSHAAALRQAVVVVASGRGEIGLAAESCRDVVRGEKHGETIWNYLTFSQHFHNIFPHHRFAAVAFRKSSKIFEQPQDGLTNSAGEGFRLEGFDGQPASLTTMDRERIDLDGHCIVQMININCWRNIWHDLASPHADNTTFFIGVISSRSCKTSGGVSFYGSVWGSTREANASTSGQDPLHDLGKKNVTCPDPLSSSIIQYLSTWRTNADDASWPHNWTEEKLSKKVRVLIFLGALLLPPPHSSRYHISDATRNLCGFRLSGLCCNEWLRRACSRAWLRYVQNIWEVLEHWEGLGMGLLSGQWGFIWTCSTIHFQARCTGICERMSWPSQCFNARHVIEQFDGRPPWKKSLVVLRRLAAYKIVMLMLCWCSMAHLPSHSAGREPKPAKQPLDCSSCSCSI